MPTSFVNSPLDCDKPPKHILVPTVINSPHSQEFMVSRNFSVVLILLDPFMDKFTLMEVFQSVNSSIKGSNKMSTTEKILETMNS